MFSILMHNKYINLQMKNVTIVVRQKLSAQESILSILVETWFKSMSVPTKTIVGILTKPS